MIQEPARRVALEARAVAALIRAGAFGGQGPRKTARSLQTLRAFGPLGAASHLSALRYGDLPAVADERGELSWQALDEAVNRFAGGLRARGLQPGDGVGILCRNHRVALIAAFAASRNGMNGVWMNTSFSERQAREVAEREGIALLVHDAEYDELAAEIPLQHGTVRVDIESAADEAD